LDFSYFFNLGLIFNHGLIVVSSWFNLGLIVAQKWFNHGLGFVGSPKVAWDSWAQSKKKANGWAQSKNGFHRIL